MDDPPKDPEDRAKYEAFAKAFVAAIKKHALNNVVIAAVTDRPLTAYWHFHWAHRAAGRAGAASPALWIETIAAEIEDQGIAIPPAWRVGYH